MPGMRREKKGGDHTRSRKAKPLEQESESANGQDTRYAGKESELPSR